MGRFLLCPTESTNMKFAFVLVASFIFLIGQYEVRGLECYQCTSEEREKCHYARSGEDESDDTWFGKKVNCTGDQDHCMIARTQYAEYVWTYVRGCATLGNDLEKIDKCHTYPGTSTETSVCFCSTDNCNGSQNLVGYNILSVLFIALSIKLMA